VPLVVRVVTNVYASKIVSTFFKLLSQIVVIILENRAEYNDLLVEID